MTSEYLLRIGLAALVGAALGAEREFRDKAAGFRTIMLICIGACMFTVFSQELITPERGDPTRIASSIVSGVGFLGAGVIFRRGRHATGITTAATIWCAAALGLGLGGGLYTLSLVSAVGILAILWVLPPVERVIDAQRETKRYEMHTAAGAISVHDLHRVFDDHDLTVTDCSHGKRDGVVITEITAIGKHERHARVTATLIDAEWVDKLSS